MSYLYRHMRIGTHHYQSLQQAAAHSLGLPLDYSYHMFPTLSQRLDSHRNAPKSALGQPQQFTLPV
jgi:hypothetical protein